MYLLIEYMHMLLMKRILESIQKAMEWLTSCGLSFLKKLTELIARTPQISVNMTETQQIHLHNLLALFLPYCIVALLIYPNFSWTQLLQEIFSLLCIYGAVFFWFMDKISDNSRYSVVIGVTACAVPIIFANNSFAVSLVFIGLIIFCEYICIEYIRGCELFSNKLPVYVVCNSISKEREAICRALTEDYKILAIYSLEHASALGKMRKKLAKFNYFSFFPFPRRILFFNEMNKNDSKSISVLSNISTAFSIPLFKATVREGELQLAPLSLQDFDPIVVTQRERDLLADGFKGKHVWIFYDGRRTVFDLIVALSEATSLTVFCESEHLIHEIEDEIRKNPDRNCKVKIMDQNLFMTADTKPEILFFNMPLEYMDSCEDNLKEAVVKNVLTVSDIVESAQKLKVKFVFMLSTTEASNTNNWIGATQRLGELVVQNIDSSAKKNSTKFRIIRIPHCMMDFSGSFKKLTAAIADGEVVRIDDYINGLHYHRNDIFHPLVKLITFSLKEQYFLPGIYSISPETDRLDDEAVRIACNLVGIRKEKEAKVVYTALNQQDKSESEITPRIAERFEKTDIDPAIIRTKFTTAELKSHELPSWTVPKLNEMSTRDVISAVFQSLKGKNSGRGRNGSNSASGRNNNRSE